MVATKKKIQKTFEDVKLVKHTNSQKFILFFSNAYFKCECEFGRHLNVKQIPCITLQESKHESPFSIIHK